MILYNLDALEACTVRVASHTIEPTKEPSRQGGRSKRGSTWDSPKGIENTAAGSSGYIIITTLYRNTACLQFD